MRFSCAITLLLLASRPVCAQEAKPCPAGPADTIPNAGQALEGNPIGWTPSQVKHVIPNALRSLGYGDVPADSTGSRFVTLPNYRYSTTWR
jgi:hypothetical protein